MWLAIYTANNESPPTSTYNIITRQPPSSFSFQKIADPVQPFASEKTAHHNLLRLRDFPPDLQDLLIVSSSASSDIGLLSRSKKPLATDKPAETITGVFTTTELLEDTRRPTLPMTDDMDDSVPIGVGLDLSATEKVYKPIPSDEELNESSTPLPGLWVLTHEGLLCSWWLVYNDSVKQGTVYPGLTQANPSDASTAPVTTAPAPAAPSAFGAPGGSAFGSAGASQPAFGSSSQPGAKPSPWGTTGNSGGAAQTGGATFGSSSFGSAPASSAPAFGKPSAFGQSSQLGMRSSPWSTGGGGTPAFGQTGFGNMANKSPTANPFGSKAQNDNQQEATTPSSAPFSKFTNQGSFGSLAGNSNNNGNGSGSGLFGGGSNTSSSPFATAGSQGGTSVFGGGNQSNASPFATAASSSNTGSSIFGGGSKPQSSPFGSSNADTAFPPKTGTSAGLSSTPFKLQSSFKPDPSARDDSEKPASGAGTSMFGSGFGSALDTPGNKPPASPLPTKDEEMDAEGSTEQTPQAKPSQSLFASQTSPESTTPKETPGALKFGSTASPTPGSSLFGQPTPGLSSGSLFGSKPDASKSTGFSLFGQKPQSTKPEQPEEAEAPLPPDTTSKLSYPLGDSSSSSATSNAPNPSVGAFATPPKPSNIPTSLDSSSKTPKPSKEDSAKTDSTGADFVTVSKIGGSPEETQVKSAKSLDPEEPVKSVETDAPQSPGILSFKSMPINKNNPFMHLKPEEDSSTNSSVTESENEEGDEGDGEEEEEEDDGADEEDGSEGSGVDVAKDLSTQTSGLAATPGYTPQSSFGGLGSTTPGTARAGQDRARPLFGEASRNAPQLPRPTEASPRSPSPLRGAVPNRVLRSEGTRSVSAPGMASQILGPKKSQSQLGNSIVSREKLAQAEDSFVAQHRKLKERQELEETRPLVDEEDDEIQKILASEVEGALELDEFVAHSNTAPPAKESVPSQVEAVYRDINSMIDTVGLNARSVKAFVKGHTEERKEDGRTKEDLEIPDDWVLCEVDELGRVLDDEVYQDLEDGRVRDLEEKLNACQELSRDMHRLRAKQEDLKKIVAIRMDPEQTEITQSLPLSAEQATQQNELRREFANFSKLLAEAEEALTLLKTRIASASGSSGRGATNVPTVEAVMRTITKMTTMVEKRSGDIDVLENQMRKLRMGTASREGSPMTPQPRKSVMFSPESTPSRTFRHSLAASVGSIGSPARATPPRKKVSGFSQEEKGELMEKRARRQAVLGKLKANVEKKGVHVWTMEDIE